MRPDHVRRLREGIQRAQAAGGRTHPPGLGADAARCAAVAHVLVKIVRSFGWL
ncbi:MAG TPA: hypothetical protein VNN22_12330 [Verrucomicrobiae bacterium]|nr:hypothetical protein [Verrucomicrobiae bacterium]